MLRATFQHLPGIGPATEARLWGEGTRSWEDLEARLGAGAEFPAEAARTIARGIEEGRAALAARRTGHFGERLAAREHWRIYRNFAKETAFLDIETTGLSPHEGIVTVVAVHGGGATRSFVADDDLEELPAYLRRFRVLVTFNGKLFDVPFLESRFPLWVPPEVHIDLRFVLYRLGQAGGLKRIEERLGVGRDASLRGVDGLEAVRLWAEHRAGRSGALERLVAYNRADTVNLEPLLDYAVAELTRRTFPWELPA